MTDITDALAYVLAKGDPWFVPHDACPACEGTGQIQVYAFRGFQLDECWDCRGSGKGVTTDPTIPKDNSHDQ